jgi:hypothetical protein
MRRNPPFGHQPERQIARIRDGVAAMGRIKENMHSRNHKKYAYAEPA